MMSVLSVDAADTCAYTHIQSDKDLTMSVLIFDTADTCAYTDIQSDKDLMMSVLSVDAADTCAYTHTKWQRLNMSPHRLMSYDVSLQSQPIL